MTSDDSHFFSDNALDSVRTQRLVDEALGTMDDGELYLQYAQSESFSFDDGRLKSAAYDTTKGFGLRAVLGEVSGYAHSSELSEDALKRARDTVTSISTGPGGTLALHPKGTNEKLYAEENPLLGMAFRDKISLLEQIDAYARDRDPKVCQVSSSITGEWQTVEIIRPGGHRVRDIRPLVRLNVSVVVKDGDRMESGYQGAGGRYEYSQLLTQENWQGQVNEALRQALVNLDSVAAPAGEMDVVLGPGWPGVLLHEAIGHGLEGDFNRKGTSAFAGLMGKRIAAPGVTIVDDGTLPNRRGSLTFDDEGTPTNCTTLIEDGILVGYMQDRMNARLMGVDATGNGRRQSYAHQPMPRMTNTYMLAGEQDPAEILAGVKDGLYAVNFGGGQVDITNGKFVFSCTEAYQIKNGKIGAPVKGATLIGNGADVLTKVSAIGNDLELDSGVGICGKGGQSVPVGVGQPTLRVDGLTVGGTEG
ncbi:metalloprotease TldD [Paremcibacter congregatus]|uniref:metalloprotease TldD n=1 Tax=Paremcibacter congregatus TaxID=2043170 RepID=UPI0030EDDCFB|tara:strand:+ start:8555 stop:9979 length:1425 start_codon:yes stop_codon:yes gene_type:complete